jgi:hypothetical protein
MNCSLSLIIKTLNLIVPPSDAFNIFRVNNILEQYIYKLDMFD